MTYTLRITKRSRHLRLSIRSGGEVVVTAPKGVPRFLIEAFVSRKATWIAENRKKILKMAPSLFPRLTSRERVAEYAAYKDKALALVCARLERYNKVYNLSYKKVSIRNQKTRWGSCSARGNVSFNYKIALLPSRCADYIVVHELCHLKEFNHSRKFWDLVEQTIPDYREIKKELRQYRL